MAIDIVARGMAASLEDAIANMPLPMYYLGVTTTPLEDGSTVDTVVVNGESITAKSGDIVIYNNSEYIFNGSIWEELGDESAYALKSNTVNGKELSTNPVITYQDTGADDYTNLTVYGYTGDDLLIIPNGTATIAAEAHKETAYKCVVIPDSVTSIGNNAFQDCRKLMRVVGGNNVTSIGGASFSGCTQLTDISLPDNLTSIDQYAFYYCINLTDMSIPSSVSSIGSGVFNDCNNFTTLDLTSYGLSKAFPTLSGNNFVNVSPDFQILVPKGRKTELSEMANWSEYADKIVEVASTETLDEQKLDKIQIPHGSTAAYVQLTNKTESFINVSQIKTPNTLIWRDNIGNAEIVTPTQDLHIANKAYVDKTHYGYSGDDLLIIPEGTTEIANNAYNSSAYKYIVIPKSVTSIGYNSFSGCNNLTGITIPDSIIRINNGVFAWCRSLTSITIPDSVTSIGSSAFSYCSSLTSITIPDSVTSIGGYAFLDCTSLKNITIGNNVMTIGGEVFRNCSSLTSVAIPNSVTSIGTYTFYNCSNLTKFDLTSYGLSKAFPSLDINVFTNTSANLQILVPKGRKSELAAMTNWSEWADKIVEVPTVETLDEQKVSRYIRPTGDRGLKLYSNDGNGEDTVTQASYYVIGKNIAQRDSNGNIQVASAIDNNDCANKQYVDAQVSTANKEANLQWGGRDLAGTFSPVDASLIEELGANRLAGIPDNKVIFERSADAGTTWAVYDNVGNGRAICTTSGWAANGNTASSKSADNWHRITIDVDHVVYCELRKIAIFLSTNGADDAQCKLEYGNYASPTVWTTEKTVPVRGWSGWNIINTNKVVGGSNYAKYVRLTFFQTSVNSTYDSNLIVKHIRFYSSNCWGVSSNLATNGHVYSYDSDFQVTFPQQVIAPTFVGALSGTAAKATGDGSGQNIADTYIKGLSANGRTITYTKGNGTAETATITYSAASQSADGLMSATDKQKLDGFGEASDYMKKDEATTIYHVKGSCTYAELIAIMDAQVGDVWNITDAAGANYVCTVANTPGADSWDMLGASITVDSITTAEINTLFT